MDMTDRTSLVLMNEEGHYRHIRSLVGFSTDVFMLEQHLKDYCSGALYDGHDGLSDLARELLVAASHQINWRDIALDLWTEEHEQTRAQALGLEEVG